jgi:hypothetical protein
MKENVDLIREINDLKREKKNLLDERSDGRKKGKGEDKAPAGPPGGSGVLPSPSPQGGTAQQGNLSSFLLDESQQQRDYDGEIDANDEKLNELRQRLEELQQAAEAKRRLSSRQKLPALAESK